MPDPTSATPQTSSPGRHRIAQAPISALPARPSNQSWKHGHRQGTPVGFGFGTK
ncbi:hypothetical protein MFUM_260006 [Methylacidiphilum fumariolicum SolV]|uniref:Uncharacterized protein n=1 Tax=Methylacidiphilum fumariolicum (strain SolV) TaxID=1156937 RepID=I0JXA7_METFB|nr:hypothetical protein MFUM_260006 [Methylacidiphilum fumariolicum SolV]